MSSHKLIPDITWFIKQNKDQVKPTEQSSRQIDIGVG
jgi:hypothetical protein